jgi:hypothetical protein
VPAAPGDLKPATWTRLDQDYEALPIDIQTLFNDLGITVTVPTAA